LPGMMLYAGMLSFISPNLQACYLEPFQERSGTATAVMGTAQFGLGGLASAASNLLPESLLSVVACIAGAAVGSLLCMLWSRRVARAPTPGS
jgi:DHA1 family bicyclomycin/chloramphenicol resistance-like MFS transporter